MESESGHSQRYTRLIQKLLLWLRLFIMSYIHYAKTFTCTLLHIIELKKIIQRCFDHYQRNSLLSGYRTGRCALDSALKRLKRSKGDRVLVTVTVTVTVYTEDRWWRCLPRISGSVRWNPLHIAYPNIIVVAPIKARN